MLLSRPASFNQYSSRTNANKHLRIHHHLRVLVSLGLYKAVLYFTLLYYLSDWRHNVQWFQRVLRGRLFDRMSARLRRPRLRCLRRRPQRDDRLPRIHGGDGHCDKWWFRREDQVGRMLFDRNGDGKVTRVEARTCYWCIYICIYIYIYKMVRIIIYIYIYITISFCIVLWYMMWQQGGICGVFVNMYILFTL